MHIILADKKEQFQNALALIVSKGRKIYFGRGPENVAVFIKDKYLVIETKGCLSKVEKNLVKEGHEKVVRDMQRTLEDRFIPAWKAFFEGALDVELSGHSSTVIFDDDLRVDFFIADRPWETCVVNNTKYLEDIDGALTIFLR